jgi:hypothetical protein
LHGRKVQYVLRRIEDTVDVWTGAILNGVLRDTEKEALSIDLYDASFRPDNDHDGLYEWEQQWFERRLPAPPASILIGAAGAGREALALRKLGYRIQAFEPSASAFRLCQSKLGSDSVDQASYQDLIATVLRGETTRLRLASEARFDAVLLGWGSFGHVLRYADRLELLRACDRIAPHGPVLLSIFEPNATAATDGTYYLRWGGFLVRPTPEELDQHATALNRQLVLSLQSPSSYATLIPGGS